MYLFVGSDDNKWLIQNEKLVALGEVNNADEFKPSHVLSCDYKEIDETSTICSFPVGMRVKVVVLAEEVLLGSYF